MVLSTLDLKLSLNVAKRPTVHGGRYVLSFPVHGGTVVKIPPSYTEQKTVVFHLTSPEITKPHHHRKLASMEHFRAKTWVVK